MVRFIGIPVFVSFFCTRVENVCATLLAETVV